MDYRENVMTFLNGNIVYDKLHLLEDGRIMMERTGKGEIIDDTKLQELIICSDLSEESCYLMLNLLNKLLDNYKTNRGRL